MVTQKEFTSLITEIATQYGLTTYAEHQYVYEIFEGGIPLFKLILAKQEFQRKAEIVVSFHIDLEVTTAIEWYVRLEGFYKDVSLTQVYLRSANGTTYLGEDAEALKMHNLEREVIETWIKDNKLEEDYEIISTEIDTPSSFSSTRDAFQRFYAMKKKKKGEVCH